MDWAIEHRGMIISIAHKVGGRSKAAGVTLDMDDLIQDASEIATKAQRTFDAQKGKASTYLYRALQRAMNLRVDYAIYQNQHEIGGIDLSQFELYQHDDFNLWGFKRSLSKPAQRVINAWLMPSRPLQSAIALRTVGRRNSLMALIHYLKEQGYAADALDAAYREILTKAKLYES
jgi:hypothetical protein